MILKEARFYKRLSQYDLEFKTGIRQSRISLAERGYLQLKETERKAIAKALKVKVEDIDWKEK